MRQRLQAKSPIKLSSAMRMVTEYFKSRLLPGTIYSGPAKIADTAASGIVATTNVDQLALWRAVTIPDDFVLLEPDPMANTFFSPIWSRHEKQVQIRPLHVEKDSWPHGGTK